MNMRIIPHYKEEIKPLLKGAMIIGIVVLAMFVINLIVSIIFGFDNNGQFSGLDSIAYIFMFVVGISSFSSRLKIAFANGISRKTQFVVSLLSAATISLVFILGFYIVGLLFSTVGTYNSAFKDMYSDYNFSSTIQYILLEVLNSFLIFISCFVFGSFIGSLYYRMGKTLKIIVSIGVPVFILIILPIIVGYISSGMPELFDTISKIFSFISKIISNPVWSLLNTFVQIVIFGLFYYLLIRKAPIKENA